MAHSGLLVSLNVFSTDDSEYLNDDIYTYIKTTIFKSKPDEDLLTKDIVKFVGNAEAFLLAKQKLDLADYDLISFVVKYFNEHAKVKYHPLTLAKQIKKQLDK